MYAVVITQNFNPESECHLFSTMEEAIKYCHDTWKTEIAREENESLYGVDHGRSYWSKEEMAGELYWNWDETSCVRYFVVEVTDRR